jgi:hypothetical protein
LSARQVYTTRSSKLKATVYTSVVIVDNEPPTPSTPLPPAIQLTAVATVAAYQMALDIFTSVTSRRLS